MVKQVFLFAEFTFDSETGTLTRKNRALHLPEQAAILLEALLKNANHLVSREELRQVLWPDEEFLDYAQGMASQRGECRFAGNCADCDTGHLPYPADQCSSESC